MPYIMKSLAGILVCVLSIEGTEAASLCKPDAAGIDLIEGNYNPPGFIPPDVEKYKGNKMPEDIIVQGWHNLLAAHRPLTLVCRYKGRPNETFTLPVDTSSCELTYKGGRIFECRQ